MIADPLTHVLILCTRHRPDDVAGCLAAIAQQSEMPAEVLVVDSSDDEATRQCVELLMPDWPDSSALRFIASEPSLTHQRIVGIAETSSDIVHFVDDDVRLDPNYIETVMNTLRNDVGEPQLVGVRRIVGVAGYMANQRQRPRVKWFDKLFGLDSEREGVVLSSGRNIPVMTRPTTELDVDWLTGAAMSYRRDALVQEPPDEIGFPFEGEDVDLSYRIAQHGRLVVTPEAKYEHLESQLNRVSGAAQAQAELCARMLRVANNSDRLSHRRAVVAGIAQLVKYGVSGIATASPRRLALAKGTWRGLRRDGA